MGRYWTGSFVGKYAFGVQDTLDFDNFPCEKRELRQQEYEGEHGTPEVVCWLWTDDNLKQVEKVLDKIEKDLEWNERELIQCCNSFQYDEKEKTYRMDCAYHDKIMNNPIGNKEQKILMCRWVLGMSIRCELMEYGVCRIKTLLYQ